MRGWIVFAFVVLALTLAAPVGAAGDRVALVIGNGAYRAATPLPNPPNDAAAMDRALRSVGFDVVTVRDAEYQLMSRAIREFGDRATGAEVALFFYAGHGLQVSGHNFLLPVNAQIDELGDLRYEAFTLSLVLAELEDADPGLSVVVLDACRNNPITRQLARQSEVLGRSAGVNEGLARTEAATGTLIAYATAPGELALDGDGRHSPFTEALTRWVVEPDLEVGLMFRRVRETVVEMTEGAQVPWVEESILGEFYFNPGSGGQAPQTVAAPGAAGAPSAEVVFWESIRDSDDPADFQAYLGRYPTGTFAALARNRLDELQNGGPGAPPPTAAPRPPSDPAVAQLAAAQTLERGLSRDQRRQVQEALSREGIYGGRVNGVFGVGMRSAIRRFQAGLGTRQTGFLTQAELDRLLGPGSRAPAPAGEPAATAPAPPREPAATAPGPAGPHLTVRNGGATPLVEVYAAPITHGSWDRNRIEGGGLPPGREIVIPLGEYGETCDFDVRAVAANGEIQESWGVDICREPRVNVY
jgi:uncharacterized caspase-like protein